MTMTKRTQTAVCNVVMIYKYNLSHLFMPKSRIRKMAIDILATHVAKVEGTWESQSYLTAWMTCAGDRLLMCLPTPKCAATEKTLSYQLKNLENSLVHIGEDSRCTDHGKQHEIIAVPRMMAIDADLCEEPGTDSNYGESYFHPCYTYKNRCFVVRHLIISGASKKERDLRE